MSIRIKGRPVSRCSPAQADIKLTQRHRNCLAAIRGGTATVGVTLGDIVGEVGKFDQALTEQTALACVGELLAATLARKSALDPNRYVITPKGLEVLES